MLGEPIHDESKNQGTLTGLLTHLQNKQLLDEAGAVKIGQYLLDSQGGPGSSTPWYLKILTGIGAWAAAIFFILFLFISKLINYHSFMGMIVWGLFFLAVAVGGSLLKKRIFTVQLSLALSIAGHLLLLVGIATELRKKQVVPTLFIVSLVLCLVLYPLYRHSLHRFLSCLLVICFAVIFIFDSLSHHFLHVLVFLELAGIILLLIKRWYAKHLQPLFFALTLSLPLLFFLVLWDRGYIGTPWWPSNIMLTIVLVLLYLQVFKESGAVAKQKNVGPIAVAVIFILLIGALSSPGILAAIAILVLGYHLGEKGLVGFGLALLPAYISIFYYNLAMTLDKKSLVLFLTGAALILMRFFLKRSSWIKPGSPGQSQMPQEKEPAAG